MDYDIKTYLKKYKEKKIIDNIFTEDVSFFTNQFNKKYNKKLECV
jgi:hypothetical protein